MAGVANANNLTLAFRIVNNSGAAGGIVQQQRQRVPRVLPEPAAEVRGVLVTEKLDDFLFAHAAPGQFLRFQIAELVEQTLGCDLKFFLKSAPEGRAGDAPPRAQVIGAVAEFRRQLTPVLRAQPLTDEIPPHIHRRAIGREI